MAAPPPARRGLGFFALLWSGTFVSSLGTGLISFGLAVSVLQETGSVSRYTLIALSALVPNLLLTPFAGAVADRYDRRFILIGSNLGAAVSNAILYHVVQIEPLDVWRIYPLLTLTATCKVFTWPTFSAVTTTVVEKRHLGRASGLTQIGGSVSAIIAPTLGGLLLVLIGLRGIVLLNLVSYLVTPCILLLIRLPKPKVSEEGRRQQGGRFLSQALVGWRFIRERPGLSQLLFTFAAINLFMSLVHILLQPLVLGFASPIALGLVLSVAACGTLVGSIVVTVWGGPKRRRVATIFTVLAGCGFLLLLGGMQPNVALVASVAFFFVLGYPIMGAAMQVIWQTKVPEDLQGRVFAARRVIGGSTMPLALIVAGPLADHVFEPLMSAGGPLADTVGRVIGVGPGRGIGLMFIVNGLFILALVVRTLRSRTLMRLEEDIPDAVFDRSDLVTAEDDARSRTAGLERPAWPAAAAIAALMLAAAVLAIAGQRPPPAVPSSAPATVFSAERAMEQVEAVSRRPHPVGSEANREVREHLLARLRELGLEAEVQTALSRRSRPPRVRLITAENVLGRLRGTGEGDGAVLLVAHYDSVPTAPGAADNGAAVATLLETARALTAGEPLANDVLFLFSDAEEPGLAGASAFVREHPWASEVAVVLNFDARGRGGPVYMFQTSPDNGRWIPLFAGGAPRPYASSLMNHVYQLLPNETDFTVFEEAGYPGFNFAFIEGLTHYHTPLDRPEELDPDSLQHQGSYALGLARHLGDGDLPAVEGEGGSANRAYFNPAGSAVVHYPRSVAFVSAVVAVAFYVAVLVFGLRRRRFRLGGLAQGALAFLGPLVAIPIAMTLWWMVVREVAGVPVLMGSTVGAGLFMIGFATLALALFAGLFRFFRRHVGLLDLAMGSLFWWLLGVVLSCDVLLPAETNFLFVWPLVAALVAVAYLAWVPREEPRTVPTFLVLAVTAVVPLFLVTPFAASVYVGLQSLVSLGGAPLVLEVLLLGTLLPQLELVTVRRPRWLPAAAAVAGLGLVAAGILNPAADDDLRLRSVLYAVDAEKEEARWFSFDFRPDDWTRQFGFRQGFREPFSGFYPPVRNELYAAEAPRLELPSPGIELREVAGSGVFREVEVFFETPENGSARLLWFEPPEAAVSVRLGDVSASLLSDDPEKRPFIERLPLPPEGETMSFRIRSGEPVTLVVVDQIEGLPPTPGIDPRPESTLLRMRDFILRSDVSLLKREVELGDGAAYGAGAPGAAPAPPAAAR